MCSSDLGKIQLALRNPLDEQVVEDNEATVAEDLGIKEPVKQTAKPAGPKVETEEEKAAKLSRPGSHRPAPDEVVVKVFRGNKLSEETFITTPARQQAKP